MSDSKVLRLFVAIELPGSVLSALTQLQHQLQRDPALANLRWVRPEGIHLTLKFLGETPAERQRAIEAAIANAASAQEPFELGLGRLGSFGSKQAPRVLWVDLTGDTQRLAQVQTHVEAELANAGFPPENRRFSPHLTLARIHPNRAREAAGALQQAIENTTVPLVTFTAEAVSFMKSDLRPGGAVYTRLFEAPLR
jgi:2'-5' RNA ligase